MSYLQIKKQKYIKKQLDFKFKLRSRKDPKNKYDSLRKNTEITNVDYK